MWASSGQDSKAVQLYLKASLADMKHQSMKLHIYWLEVALNGVD